MATSFRCCISNSIASHPVIGIPTGLIYEKSTIEKALSIEEKCPVSGITLKKQDLVAIKLNQPQINPPRSLEATSIPSLLSAFQEEWDAVALETFKLRQLLEKTRKELAQALYQHDAACKVIARLAKERDEARLALSSVTAVPAHNNNNVPVESIPEEKKEKKSTTTTSRKGSNDLHPLTKEEEKDILSLNDTLQSSRSAKRKAMTGSSDSFELKSHDLFKSEKIPITCMDLSEANGKIVIGLDNGSAVLISRSTGKVEQTTSIISSGEASITKIKIYENSSTISACSDSKIRVVSSSQQQLHVNLKAAPTDCVVHATKKYGLTSDESGLWYIFRLATGEIVSSSSATGGGPLHCIDVHPDGKLFATGSNNIGIWDILTGKSEMSLKEATKDSTTNLSFSENGTALGACTGGIAKIWDMRKLQAPVHSFNSEKPISCCKFDATGQIFAFACENGTFEVKHVVRTGAWPVAFKNSASSSGILSIFPGKGSVLALYSNNIIKEWRES